MRKFLLLSVLSTLILCACQQEIADLIPEIQQGCRIKTGFYYGGSGVPNDSANFTYENGKVVRADALDTYVLYSYVGDNITGRKIFNHIGDELIQSDSIQYTSDNKIARMVSWHYNDPFWADTVRIQYLFYYSGNNIQRVTEVDQYNDIWGPMSDTLHNFFTTNAAGNIEKLVLADQFGDPFDSTTYSFDVNPNYFTVAHKHFFLFDPYFQLHVGLVPHLPYFYSKNNVDEVEVYAGIPYDISYGLDSLEKITALDLDGFEYMKYKYECQ